MLREVLLGGVLQAGPKDCFEGELGTLVPTEGGGTLFGELAGHDRGLSALEGDEEVETAHCWRVRVLAAEPREPLLCEDVHLLLGVAQARVVVAEPVFEDHVAVFNSAERAEAPALLVAFTEARVEDLTHLAVDQVAAHLAVVLNHLLHVDVLCEAALLLEKTFQTACERVHTLKGVHIL